MPDPSPLPLVIIIVEAGCWLTGLILLWRLIAGHLGPRQTALAPWPVSLEAFFTGVLIVAGCTWLLPQIPAHLGDKILGPAAHDGDWWLIIQGAAFQLGLLGGALLAGLYLRRQVRRATPPADPRALPPAGPQPTARPVLAGTVTFLISLPLIHGIGLAWKTLLDSLGFPTGEQEMIDLFRSADDPVLLAFMIFLAAVIAPITEELIFRAGLFRYLRTRVSRGFALVIPALLFGLLHGNLTAFLPIFALGLLFSLAYERTGRIAVPMIAHALFNLNTIVLAMAGVTG
jgi:uncharacterized protein